MYFNKTLNSHNTSLQLNARVSVGKTFNELTFLSREITMLLAP